MSGVPLELEREILLRLPAESLFRFRAVCKSWQSIIDDPSFVRTHTTNNHLSSPNLILFSTAFADCRTFYSLPLDSLNYINGQQTVHARTLVQRGLPWIPTPKATCNGLILVVYPSKNWEIWNPLNGSLQQLPQPDYEEEHTRLIGAGIGYDSNSDDYKVVRIHRIHNRDGAPYRTLIYSLKSNSWKRGKDCPPYLPYFIGGLFSKGGLHWMSSTAIVALDMATEEYWLLPLPMPLMFPVCVTFDVLGEYLVITVDVSVWVMRGYGGEKPYWEELYSSEQGRGVIGSGVMFPVAYNETQRRLILQDGNTIIRWDIEKRAAKRVTIDGLQNCYGFYSKVVPGSLFRFKTGPVGVAAAIKRLRLTAATIDYTA